MSLLWKTIVQTAAKFYAPVETDKAIAPEHFDDVQPELMIKFLHQMPNVKLFTGLSRKLKASSNEWTLEFLQLRGLDTLFEVLEELDGFGRKKFADAFLAVQCVGCIRSLLNSDIGLGFMVHSEGLARKLVTGE